MDAKYRIRYKAVPGFIAGFIAVISVSSYHLNAEAYLNPGTGSMILQALIAGIAVVAVTVKMYWFRLVAFFNGEFSWRVDSGINQKKYRSICTCSRL